MERVEVFKYYGSGRLMAMDDNNIHAVRGTGQSQEISQKFDLYFTASKSRECIAKGSRHVLQSNCAGDTTFRK